MQNNVTGKLCDQFCVKNASTCDFSPVHTKADINSNTVRQHILMHVNFAACVLHVFYHRK